MDSTTPLTQPKSSKRFIISLLLFIIFLLTIPFGVYLVQQRTNFLPKASNSTLNQNLETVLALESDTQKETGEVSVTLLLSSEQDTVNLIYAQILYPAETLVIDSLESASADLSGDSANRVTIKTIRADLSNDGKASLILGIPEGIKTEPGKKFQLGVLKLKARRTGTAKIAFDDSSEIYKSSDNSKVKVSKKDLELNLTSFSSEIKEKNKECQQKPECLSAKPACSVPEPAEGWCDSKEPILKLVSPMGGETYSYKNQIPISWEAQNTKNVSISLLLNGSLMGKIATAAAEAKSYLWNPLQTLTYAFIYPYNAFQVKLESLSESGKKLEDLSKGPFTISLAEDSLNSTGSAKIVNGNGDLNKDGEVGLTDLSILISNYKKEQISNKEADLNGDNLVNDIDIWLLQGLLN